MRKERFFFFLQVKQDIILCRGFFKQKNKNISKQKLLKKSMSSRQFCIGISLTRCLVVESKCMFSREGLIDQILLSYKHALKTNSFFDIIAK
jgi:hypothetical protein